MQKPNLVIRRNPLPDHSAKILNPLVLKDDPVADRSYIERWITQYWRDKIEPIKKRHHSPLKVDFAVHELFNMLLMKGEVEKLRMPIYSSM